MFGVEEGFGLSQFKDLLFMITDLDDPFPRKLSKHGTSLVSSSGMVSRNRFSSSTA